MLTLFGGFAAGQVSKRWLTQFSIPGYSAYEANQQTLKIFGTGEQAPLIAVFHSSGDVTKQRGIARRGRGGAAGESRLALGVVLLDRRAGRTSPRIGTRRSPRSIPPESRLQRKTAHRRDARGAEGGDADRA